MFVRTLLSVLSLSALVACGGSPAMDPQLPPTTGRTDVEAWLTAGLYKSWSCEPTSHTKRSPSPHDQNRICSNAALSGFAGTGEYPVGAAGVKELFDDTGKTIIGYAVAVHTKAGNTGDTWYWYERVPLTSAAPHDANGVVADGSGASGPAQTICVGCHQAAGSDAGHSGHNFVYTQVK